MLFNLWMLIISFSVTAQSEPKKILFLDVNDAKEEVARAQLVARQKGYELIVYPSKGHEFSQREAENLLFKHNFNSLIISGHNGGTQFSGNNGFIHLPELMEKIAESPNQKSIESLYLLGCNAGNKSKIFWWKEALPELKFIAGYDASAPLSHDARGLGLFGDLLNKEDHIKGAADGAKLKAMLEGVNNINSFEASIYASCGPEQNEWHFLPGRKGSERFGQLSAAECAKKVHELKTTWLPEIKKYWDAQKEPIELNPSQGFLKDAYVFIRQNEHCLFDEDNNSFYSDFNGDALLMLRFNKDFNRNFVEYYRPFLQDLMDELIRIESDREKVASEIAEQAKKDLAILNEVKNKKGHYKALASVEKKALQDEMNALYRAHGAQLEGCWDNPSPTCAGAKKIIEKIQQLSSAMDIWENFERNLDEKIEKLAFKSKDEVQDSLRYHHRAQITAKEQLQQVLTEKGTITRKSMLNLASSIYGISSEVDYSQKAKLIMIYNQTLNEFPFSWHEPAHGKIEDPTYNELKLENVQNKNKALVKNPQLQELARLLAAD
jgi:hypothetical protein